MRDTATGEAIGTRGPGRPRSADAGASILAAARSLLQQGGYDAVTMEAVASRAGVAKTTVYRRYPNRAALVADAALEVLSVTVPADDRGSLWADLEAVLEGLTGPHSARMADVFLRLATESLGDADTRRILNDRVLARRRAMAGGILERAAARGELARPIDPETLLDLIGGGLMFNAARQGGQVDDRYRAQVLDLIVAGLTAPVAPPASSSRRRRAGHGKEAKR